MNSGNRRVRPYIVITLMLPALSMWLYFVFVPMLRSFYISLTEWNGFTSEKLFIGIENYRQLLGDATMHMAMGNTMFYILFGGAVTFFLSIWFAYLLTKPGFRGEKLFSNFFYFPNMISPAALAVLWVFFFNPNFGLLNAVLQKVGLGSLIIPWLGARESARVSIALVTCISSVGFYLILNLAGIARIPPTYMEAAAIDGAGNIRCFFSITLPLLRDVLVISVSLWIINSVKFFEVIWAMFSGRTHFLQNLATYMYTVSFGVQVPIFKLGYGSAISVVMFLIVVVGVGVFRKIFDREDLQY